MNVWLFNRMTGRYDEVSFEFLRALIDDCVVVAWDRDMNDVEIVQNHDGKHLRFNKDEFRDDVWRAFTGPLGMQIAYWDFESRSWIKDQKR